MSYKWALVISSLMVFSEAIFADSAGTLDATQPYHPFDPSSSRTDPASRSNENNLEPFDIPKSLSSVENQSSPPPPPTNTVPSRRKTN